MEFDLDKALEEVPIHEEDSPPPPLSDKMPTYFGELPTMEARKLEHHTKLRPKPKKRTKPSRAPVRPSTCPLSLIPHFFLPLPLFLPSFSISTSSYYTL